MRIQNKKRVVFLSHTCQIINANREKLFSVIHHHKFLLTVNLLCQIKLDKTYWSIFYQIKRVYKVVYILIEKKEMNCSTQRLTNLINDYSILVFSSLSILITITIFVFIVYHLIKRKNSPHRVALLLTGNMYFAYYFYSLF
jgi:hypothetical protein